METPGTPSNGGNSGFQIPPYILDDLCSRFIINIPEEERQDLIRIFFQIELAHWFYLDFYCQENPELRACGIKDFSGQIFHHCPTLINHADNVDKILETWRGYKMAVPTYGAIMLDSTLHYCLLVQGFWSKASWGFPKGKVNEDEAPDVCAIREVYEETGFDISQLIDREEYVEYQMNEQLSRLYIVRGISMDTKFAPRTRKEIKKLDWFKIEYLPAHKKDLQCKTQYNLPPNAFFMVIPFVKPLRKWVCRQLGGSEPDSVQKSGRQSHTKDQALDGRQSAGKLKPQALFSPAPGETGESQGRGPKGGNAKSRQGNSKSPSVAHAKGRERQHAASPKQKKQLQILRRDGSTSGNTPRKALTAQFGNTSQPSPRVKKHIRKGEFFSQTWANFKLDTDALLACL